MTTTATRNSHRHADIETGNDMIDDIDMNMNDDEAGPSRLAEPRNEISTNGVSGDQIPNQATVPREPLTGVGHYLLTNASRVGSLWEAIRQIPPVSAGSLFSDVGGVHQGNVGSNGSAHGQTNRSGISLEEGLASADGDATAGFGFNVQASSLLGIPLIDLTLLIDFSHCVYVEGNMNPLVRLFYLSMGCEEALCRCIVTSDESALDGCSIEGLALCDETIRDFLSSFSAKLSLVSRDRPANRQDDVLSIRTERQLPSSLVTHFFADIATDLNATTDIESSALSTFFRDEALKFNRLQDALVRIEISERLTKADLFSLASKFKAILARLHDLRNLYSLLGLTYRGGANTMGYNAFLHNPNISQTLNSLLSFERSIEEIVNDQYAASSHANLLSENMPPVQPALVAEVFSTPLDSFSDRMEAIAERQLMEEIEASISGSQNGDGANGGGLGGGRGRGNSGRGRGAAGRGSASGNGQGNGNPFVDDDTASVISFASTIGSKKKRKIENSLFTETTMSKKRMSVLYQHLLFQLSHFGFQRNSNHELLAPVFNVNGEFVHAYRTLESVEDSGQPVRIIDFVRHSASSLVNRNIFSILRSNIQSLAAQLEETREPHFPFHVNSRNLLSFSDGVLHVPSATFLSFAELSTISSISRGSAGMVDAVRPILSRIHHPASSAMRNRAKVDQNTNELIKTVKFMKRVSSCAYASVECLSSAKKLKDLRYAIEKNVIDKLYPRVDGYSVRHPQANSPPEIFNLFLDLITAEFRKYVTQNMTIFDRTFLHQLGFSSSSGYTTLDQRECNVAARNLRIWTDMYVHERQTCNVGNTYTNVQHASSSPVPQQSHPIALSTTTAQRDSLQSFNEAIRFARMQASATLAGFQLDGGGGGENGIGSQLVEAVSKLDAIESTVSSALASAHAEALSYYNIPQVDTSANSSTHEPSGDNVAQGTIPLRIIPENDRHAYSLLGDYGHLYTSPSGSSSVGEFCTPEHQGYRALLIIYAIFGTYFVDRNPQLELDLPIAIWLRGAAGTGKTKTIQRLFELVYGKNHVATINDNCEETFGISPILKPEFYVAVGNEITPTTTFPRSTYLSWITDGTMRLPVKFKNSSNITIRSKPIFGCNLLPCWPDDGATSTSPGSFSRRSLVMPFDVPLTNPLTDKEFDDKLTSDMAMIMMLLSYVRSIIVPIFTVSTFWSRAGIVINQWRLETTNSLRPYHVLFIGSGYFDFRPDYYISEIDLKKIVDVFKASNKDKAKVNFQDLTTYLLSLTGVRKEKNKKPYVVLGQVSPKEISGDFFFGLRFSVTVVAYHFPTTSTDPLRNSDAMTMPSVNDL